MIQSHDVWMPQLGTPGGCCVCRPHQAVGNAVENKTGKHEKAEGGGAC